LILNLSMYQGICRKLVKRSYTKYFVIGIINNCKLYR